MKFTLLSLRFATLAGACALAGCATNQDYALYAATQKSVAVAKSDAEVARYKALSDIAANGNDVSKVAAVMGLAFANSGGAPNNPTMVQPPVSTEENVLRWAQLLVPSVTQIYGINSATRLGIAQSDNSARVAESTNSAFVGIAGKIQAPAANYTYGANSGAYSGTTVVGANSGTNSGNTSNTTSNTTTSTNTNTTTTYPTTPTPPGKVCSVSATGVVTCV